jgi:hypothetical protein
MSCKSEEIRSRAITTRKNLRRQAKKTVYRSIPIIDLIRFCDETIILCDDIRSLEKQNVGLMLAPNMELISKGK